MQLARLTSHLRSWIGHLGEERDHVAFEQACLHFDHHGTEKTLRDETIEVIFLDSGGFLVGKTF